MTNQHSSPYPAVIHKYWPMYWYFSNMQTPYAWLLEKSAEKSSSTKVRCFFFVLSLSHTIDLAGVQPTGRFDLSEIRHFFGSKQHFLQRNHIQKFQHLLSLYNQVCVYFQKLNFLSKTHLLFISKVTDWTFISHQNSHVETLTPNMMVFGGRVLGGWLG